MTIRSSKPLGSAPEEQHSIVCDCGGVCKETSNDVFGAFVCLLVSRAVGAGGRELEAVGWCPKGLQTGSLHSPLGAQLSCLLGFEVLYCNSKTKPV